MQAARKRKSGRGQEQECDPLGLVAAFRRLLAVVANKRCNTELGRDSAEIRARAEDLKGEVKVLTTRLQEHGARLQKAEESERQAKSLLDISRTQWGECRRRLEDSLKEVEDELRGAERERDEAQSALAVTRHQISCVRRKYPQVAAEVLADSQSPSPRRTDSARQELERRLEQKTQELAEARDYAARVYEKLESKDAKKKEYKDRLRQAEETIRSLKDEKERERSSFRQQVSAVRDEVLRMRGDAPILKRATTAPIGSPRRSPPRPTFIGSPRSEGRLAPYTTHNLDGSPRSARSSSPGRHRELGWSDGRRPQPRGGNRSFGSPSPRAAGNGKRRAQPALTVPQGPKLSGPRGRTGCYHCDGKDGPSHYSSVTAVQTTKRKSRSSSAADRSAPSRTRSPVRTVSNGSDVYYKSLPV